jgi:rod shape-determining protein MreC
MNKPLFERRSALNLRLTVGVVAALVLLGVEQHGAWASLRTPIAVVVYPLQKFVSSPARFFRELRESLDGYENLAAENRRLKEEALVLKTRQLKFDALEHENIRLRGLLDNSFKVGEQLQIGEIMSVNLAPYEHLVVVNKGSRFGVHPGQPVFDSHGVMGQVLRVTPYSAEVMLITDPSHAIPVQVSRNGLRTVAMGTGESDRLALPFLPSNADLKAGDLLVTSGMGGVFPAGYPVATVTGLPQENGALTKIKAVPLAHLDRNQEVLLVWNDAQPIPRIPTPAETPGAAPAHGER